MLCLKMKHKILSELNIPGISKTALKAREREIGATFEAVAATSCESAIKEEIAHAAAVNEM